MPGACQIRRGAVRDGARTKNTYAQSMPRSLFPDQAISWARKLVDGGKLSSRADA
jgi:hypothetical protein